MAFPSQAQGWITLNCTGLTEEQKAIVKAKAQGSLDVDQISAAFRSCFPLYKAGSKARRAVSTLVVEPELEEDQVDAAAEFDDVEASLAECKRISCFQIMTSLETRHSVWRKSVSACLRSLSSGDLVSCFRRLGLLFSVLIHLGLEVWNVQLELKS